MNNDKDRAEIRNFGYEIKEKDNNREIIYQGKKSGRNNKKIIAGLLIVMIIFVSAGAGFAGALIANNYMQSQNKAEGVTNTELPVSSTKSDNSDNVSGVVKTCSDSVVSINTETKSESTDMFGRSAGEQTTEGAGSGVIITTNGYIVTNNHVVDGANKITVTTTNGKSYDAKLIGKDAESDLAVIKIDAQDLAAVSMATSSNLEVGDKVVVIGNPLGELSGTVTDGIVSALGREVEIEGYTMKLIQTNASISPGNSGGGLFDMNGRLVGIINAKSSGDGVEGIGFAIPMDTVKGVVEKIMDYGYVPGRPYAGVSLVDVADEQTAYQYGVNSIGVYIADFTDNSAAENAGLKVGDRIVKVDGEKVESATEFKDAIYKKKVGNKVKIEVNRSGKSLSIEVKLAEKKSDN